jgi:YVTN family beta-propeller protein
VLWAAPVLLLTATLAGWIALLGQVAGPHGVTAMAGSSDKADASEKAGESNKSAESTKSREPNEPTIVILARQRRSDGGTRVTLHTRGLEVSDAARYRWSFGDGQNSSFQSSPRATHHYAGPGHYTVIVAVRDEGQLQTINRQVTIARPRTNPAPANSSRIIYDTKRDRVWTVNPDNDTVTAIDATNLTKEAEVAVGEHPTTVALGPGDRLWVVCRDEPGMTLIDPERFARIDEIPLPRGSRPFGIVFDPARDRAGFLTLEATGQLCRIDAKAKRIVKSVRLGPRPRHLAMTSEGRLLIGRFISGPEQGEVYTTQADDLTDEATIELPIDPGPDAEDDSRGLPNYLRALAVSPDGKRCWVPSVKSNIQRGPTRDGKPLTFETTVRTHVSRIKLDTLTDPVEDRHDFDDKALASAVTFTPRGDYAIITTQGTNTVEVLDAYTAELVSTVQTELAPHGVVLSPKGDRLFVLNYLARSVTVFDAGGLLHSNEAPTLSRVKSVSTVGEEKLPKQVLRGKRVFYNADDPRMNQDGYISCAVCHFDGGQDGRVWDFTARGEGLRNTITLRGRATNQGRLHWFPNFDEVQDFEHDIRNQFGGEGFLSDKQFHKGTRDQPLGETKAGLSQDLDALAAYVRSLDRGPHSPYRAADGSLTPAGRAGRRVFERENCQKCHSGRNMTNRADNALYNPDTLERIVDEPASPPTGVRVPTLRGVFYTPPYLHDGSAPTLEAVFKESGPHGIGELTRRQKSQLIAYLKQIEGG